jgi:hypothetical protein
VSNGHGLRHDLDMWLESKPKDGAAGRFETRARGRWKSVDFAHPGGRWCVVAWCKWCGRTMRDTYFESLFMGSKFGAWLGPRPLCSGYWNDKDEGLCDDCRAEPVFTPVLRCAVCGVLKKDTPVGVHWRYFQYAARTEIEAILPSINDEDKALCVSCWNRLKPIAAAFESAEAARLLVNRIRRKINESTKNTA